ncbi:hypothetical protein [Stenotrophomonas sp. WZN-1]|uniref:hypothetical protein n=1 Tax=Stenotrophomonas sp. WZN-1 TaxID=2005046 RepID=UPI001E4ECF92|nr:hypothetical protein [Stenotrophomonas sp. WZN-1]
MAEVHTGGFSNHLAFFDDQAQTIRCRLADARQEQKLTGVDGQQQRSFVHGHQVQ